MQALGDFLMVDVDSSNILHFTFSCILVDIDASKWLLVEINIPLLKALGFNL